MPALEATLPSCQQVVLDVQVGSLNPALPRHVRHSFLTHHCGTAAGATLHKQAMNGSWVAAPHGILTPGVHRVCFAAALWHGTDVDFVPQAATVSVSASDTGMPSPATWLDTSSSPTVTFPAAASGDFVALLPLGADEAAPEIVGCAGAASVAVALGASAELSSVSLQVGQPYRVCWAAAASLGDADSDFVQQEASLRRTSLQSVGLVVSGVGAPPLGITAPALALVEGQTAASAYSLALLSSPGVDAPVVIQTLVHDPTEPAAPGIVVADSLVFTNSNWSTAAPVAVQAPDNVNVAATASRLVTLYHRVSYLGTSWLLQSANVTIVLADDDAAALVVAPHAGADSRGAVPAGVHLFHGPAPWPSTTQTAFTLSLASQPTTNVVVTLAAPGSMTLVSPSSATLTFTPTTWATPQAVTVQLADLYTPVVDASETVTLTASSGASDPYNALVTPVAVSILHDTPGLEIVTAVPGGALLDEDAPTLPVQYTVRLTGQPTGDVTVSVLPPVGQLLPSPTELIFSRSQYATARTFKVSSPKRGHHGC